MPTNFGLGENSPARSGPGGLAQDWRPLKAMVSWKRTGRFSTISAATTTQAHVEGVPNLSKRLVKAPVY